MGVILRLKNGFGKDVSSSHFMKVIYIYNCNFDVIISSLYNVGLLV